MSSARAKIAALIAGWALAGWILSCAPAPDTLAPDAGLPGSDAAAAPQLTLLLDRPFGPEGELPLQLLGGPPEQLWARSNAALYRLDLEGRVLQRQPLPAVDELPVPLYDAASTGSTIALALRWPRAAQLASGSYLTVLDAGEQLPAPPSWLALGGPASIPQLVWDGAHWVAVWSEPQPAGELALLRRRVAPGAPVQPDPSAQLGSLPAGTSLGDLISSGPEQLALCSVSPEGEVQLRRWSGDSALPPLTLPRADTPARPGCRLASSGRSTLITLLLAPAAADDAGPATDGGLGQLRFARPVAQLLDPAGAALPAPLPLSSVEGTVDIEDLLWDGARYLVLLNAAGYRGGRLLLTLLDESGQLLVRDLLLPLAVEPGQLLGGRLLATPSGLFLLYALQRPWDQGILRLARLDLRLP